MFVAIPSPDVLVNLFASAAQALGLLTVVVGGFLARRRSTRTTPGRASRLWTTVFAVGFVGTLVALFLYWLHVEEARTSRLRTNLFRSSVENGQSVGDASLKTLGYSAQLEHPLGVSTEQLAAELEGAVPPRIIDVREPEEIETGAIPSSSSIRYPDLQVDPAALGATAAAPTVLMCWSGNRSSELASWFGANDTPCRFVVGGYEKWIAEGRKVATPGGGSDRASLRALPEHPGHAVLLDTDEVRALVADRGAVFVDVRYPGDFARSPLPGAINLPIRKLTTAELDAAIASLPAGRPVIAPCYDKRSSFYGSILGVRVHRAGGEFLGRYTVPHEYWLPRAGKAWVTAWEQAQAGWTPWGALVGALAATLGWLVAGLGLGWGIVALVVGCRVLLLPWTWPAECDSWRRRQLAPKAAALKRQFADDPARAHRAISSLYDRAGIRSLRGFVTSLVVLTLFLGMFGAVHGAAVGSNATWLGLPLGVPDGLRILPVLVGALIVAHVCSAAVGAPSTKRVLAGLLFGAGFVALTWTLSAAVNLYLVLGLAFVVGQGLIARRRVLRTATPPARGPIVPLDRAHGLPVGNKAARLATMRAAGLPVPGGFCVMAGALHARVRYAPKLLRAFDRLGAEHVAVRSSGLAEDGAERSYAGVFESVLDVSRDGLLDALATVTASFSSARAVGYDECVDGDAAVLVQAMIPATYAGVLFTEHPATAGQQLVELVEGCGEALVSGTATPRAYSFGRLSGEASGAGDAPPIDLGPLLGLGRSIEALFGCAQDIEWAWADGRFYILQARDITALNQEPLEVARRERLKGIEPATSLDAVVFEQNELTELLPSPNPFSLGLMQSLWAAGGAVDRACRSLGVPYRVDEDAPQYVVDLFGTLAADVSQRAARSAPLGAVASFRLERLAAGLENELREHVLPAWQRRQRRRDAIDTSRFSDEGVFDEFDATLDRILTDVYVDAERANIAADLYLQQAVRKLRKAGHEPAHFLSYLPETVVGTALKRVAEGDRDGFLTLFGHRAPHDFDLAEPRYREAPQFVDDLAVMSVGSRRAGEEAPSVDSTMLRTSVERARRFQALKEEVKHFAVADLAYLRNLLLEIGARTGLGDDVFWLMPAEVSGLRTRAADQFAPLIDARRAERAAFAGLRVPTKLTLRDLERWESAAAESAPRRTGQLAGTWIAGDAAVVGRVRVLGPEDRAEVFEDGEILVARFTEPRWASLFTRASGVITEVGGWLSHAAILAREFHLPCVVGVEGAVDGLQTGDVVSIGPDGSVDRVSDAAAARVPAAASKSALG